MKPVNQATELLQCGQSRDTSGEIGSVDPTVALPPAQPRLAALAETFASRERLVQFIKFCMVGGSGVFVDMGMLFLLADPRTLGLNVTLSKIFAAQVAMVNNFIWNEFWTFRKASGARARSEVRSQSGLFRRFAIFNAFCGLGLALAVLLLHLFHSLIGWNLYLSNMLAICLVTFWNFGMTARFSWPTEKSFHTRRL